MRKVFIAWDLRAGYPGSHVLLEVFPRATKQGTDKILDRGLAEQLAGWESLQDLIGVLEKTGPLIASDLFENAPRTIGIEEAVDIAEHGNSTSWKNYLAPCTAELLHSQCLLIDGDFDAKRPSLASVRRAIEGRGLFESNGAEDLKEWLSLDPGCKVAIEPLNDFVLLRNLGNAVVRMLANLRTEKTDNLFDASGFRLFGPNRAFWDRRGLVGSYWTLSLCTAAVEEKVDLAASAGSAPHAATITHPLLSLIASLSTARGHHRFGSIPNAVLLQPKPLRPPSPEIIVDAIYLGIEAEDSPRDAAESFILSLRDLMGPLATESGDDVGFQFLPLDPFADDPPAKLHCHTLMGSFMCALLFRYGYDAAVCRRCGKGILVPTRGKRRDFCSNSCRTRYYSRAVTKHPLRHPPPDVPYMLMAALSPEHG